MNVDQSDILCIMTALTVNFAEQPEKLPNKERITPKKRKNSNLIAGYGRSQSTSVSSSTKLEQNSKTPQTTKSLQFSFYLEEISVTLYEGEITLAKV